VSRLELVPCSIQDAREYVFQFHRHHPPPLSGFFAVAVSPGYRKLGTYTLASEPGTSLKAAGWRLVGQVKGRSWDTPSRPRVDRHPTQDKIRWEISA
jgi:hypothetical protein